MFSSYLIFIQLCCVQQTPIIPDDFHHRGSGLVLTFVKAECMNAVAKPSNYEFLQLFSLLIKYPSIINQGFVRIVSN